MRLQVLALVQYINASNWIVRKDASNGKSICCVTHSVPLEFVYVFGINLVNEYCLMNIADRTLSKAKIDGL